MVDGEPLSAALRREGRLAPVRTLQIVRQVAAGLAAAHGAGVVHRDVKPSNLLLGSDGTVKIIDFGIAWSRSSDPLTGTGEVMGTAQYLSPEQAKGAMAVAASDVYALGMVAYECLAGRRPFDGASPVQVALMHANRTPEPLPADVPESVRKLVARMLVKNPEERYADGAALLAPWRTSWRSRRRPAAGPGCDDDHAGHRSRSCAGWRGQDRRIPATPACGPRPSTAPATPDPAGRGAGVASRSWPRSSGDGLRGADRAPAPVAGSTQAPTTAPAVLWLPRTTWAGPSAR